MSDGGAVGARVQRFRWGSLRQVIAARPGVAFDVAILLVAEYLVFKAVSPTNLFTNVLPLGGDNSGHPYAVQLIKTRLEHGSLTGWSNGWLSGFPIGTFYPWVADVLAALLSFVMPLAIAVKLVIALGAVGLPIAAYQAARWGGFTRPLPALFAVFALPQVFDVSCNICGGSLNSTFAGEYAYELGIPLGLLAIGALSRTLRGDGSRALTAALFALALLAHPITALWTTVAALILVVTDLVQRRAIRRRWVLPVAVGGVISLAWWIPFLAYDSYTAGPIFAKSTAYGFLLFPASGGWEFVITVIAIVGAVAALRCRLPFAWALTGVTALSIIAVPLVPTGQLPNFRIVPLWSTGRWFLVGLGLYETVVFIAAKLRDPAPVKPVKKSAKKAVKGKAAVRASQRRRLPDIAYLVPVAALLFVAVMQGVPWGLYPGEQYRPPAGSSNVAQGNQRWLGLTLPGVGQSTQAAQLFSGYRADAQSRADYPALIRMLESVAATHGCGRVAADENAPGEPYALGYHLLDQLPLITHGCLTYLVGTRGDGSQNYAAALSAMSLLSQNPEQAMPGVPYYQFDVKDGIVVARSLGLRYYLTYDATARKAAAGVVGLTLVGSAAGVDVWQLDAAAVVAPLVNQPVRVVGPGDWQTYYLGVANRQHGAVAYSPDGPADWPVVHGSELAAPQPLPSIAVSDVTETDTQISFSVSSVGVPVLVRTTWFPGWHASGARGPFRATPDYMIVVPTSTSVSLRYSQTALTTSATVLGWLGLASLLGLLIWDFADRRSRGVSRSELSRLVGI